MLTIPYKTGTPDGAGKPPQRVHSGPPFVNASQVVSSFHESMLPTSVLASVGGMWHSTHDDSLARRQCEIRLSRADTLQPLGFADLAVCLGDLGAPGADIYDVRSVPPSPDASDFSVRVLVYTDRNTILLVEIDTLRRRKPVYPSHQRRTPYLKASDEIPGTFAALESQLEQECAFRPIWTSATSKPGPRITSARLGLILKDDGDPSVGRSLIARGVAGKVTLELRDLENGTVVKNGIRFDEKGETYGVYAFCHDRLHGRLVCSTDEFLFAWDLCTMKQTFSSVGDNDDINPGMYEIWCVDCGMPGTKVENSLFVGADTKLSLMDLRALGPKPERCLTANGYIKAVDCSLENYVAMMDGSGLIVHDLRKLSSSPRSLPLHPSSGPSSNVAGLAVTRTGGIISGVGANNSGSGKEVAKNGGICLTQAASSLDGFKVVQETGWSTSGLCIASTCMDDRWSSQFGRTEELERLSFVSKCPFVSLQGLRSGGVELRALRCFVIPS